MPFRFKGVDWWTPREWLPAPEDSKCVVCGSSFSVAMHPDKLTILCEFHSQCTDLGIDTIIASKNSGDRISLEVWNTLRLNSYDRDSLIPYMSDAVLFESVENALKNCRLFARPATTYDEAIQLYAREMMSRMLRNS